MPGVARQQHQKPEHRHEPAEVEEPALLLWGEAEDCGQVADIDQAREPDGDMFDKIGDLVRRVADAGVLEVDNVAAFPVPEEVADVAIGLGEHALGERAGERGDCRAGEPRGGGSQGRLDGCAGLLVRITDPRTDCRESSAGPHRRCGT